MEHVTSTANALRNLVKSFDTEHATMVDKLQQYIAQIEEERKSMQDKADRDERNITAMRSQIAELMVDKNGLQLKVKDYVDAIEKQLQEIKTLRENEQKYKNIAEKNATLLEETQKLQTKFAGLYQLHQDKVKECNELSDKYHLLKNALFAVFEHRRQTRSIDNEDFANTTETNDPIFSNSVIASPEREAKSEVQVVDLGAQFLQADCIPDFNQQSTLQTSTCTSEASNAFQGTLFQNEASTTSALPPSSATSVSSCYQSTVVSSCSFNPNVTVTNSNVVNFPSENNIVVLTDSPCFGGLVNVVEQKQFRENEKGFEKCVDENILYDGIIIDPMYTCAEYNLLDETDILNFANMMSTDTGNVSLEPFNENILHPPENDETKDKKQDRTLAHEKKISIEIRNEMSTPTRRRSDSRSADKHYHDARVSNKRASYPYSKDERRYTSEHRSVRGHRPSSPKRRRI